MTRWMLLGFAGVLVLLGSACEKTDVPTDPVWGKEACAHCSMLVGDRRYAAQAVAGGERRYFDDIGCMVLWMEDRRSRPDHVWVRSRDRWVDAESARYARGAKTPMDFGLEARPDDGIGWDEARAHVLAKRSER